MKVLIVDDDLAARTILTKVLLDAKYEVRSVAEGADALGVLASVPWKPDVILLDFLMPGMTGGDVLEAMKALQGLHQAPVILVTSEEQIPDQARLLAHAVLRKPVPFPDLLDAIRAALEAPAKGGR